MQRPHYAEEIGHVRYINILTWLRGFQVKPLYLVLFSLYLSLFWELRGKRKLEKFAILTRKHRSHARILYVESGLLGIYAMRTSITLFNGFLISS